MPFFSVIVPIYKAERYLTQCINSIIGQSFTDFELILVDDGSPDACPVLCDEYARTDQRIRVIHKENGGIVNARKAGLSIAEGQYVLFVDSDDYVNSEWMYCIYTAICANNMPDVVAFGFSRITEAEELLEIYDNAAQEGMYSGETFEQLRTTMIFDTANSKLNVGCLAYALWAKAIKRSLFGEGTSLPPDAIVNGEDVAFFFPLLSKCTSLYVMKNNDYRYRYIKTSMVNEYRPKEIQRLKVLFEFLYKEVSGIPAKNLDAYAYYLIQGHVIETIRHIEDYSAYRVYIKEKLTTSIRQIICKVDITRMTIKDAVRAILLKMRLYNVLWYIYR